MKNILKKTITAILCFALCTCLAATGAYAVKNADSSSSEKKAIIVIPGITASELYKETQYGIKKIWISEDFLECKCDENGEPLTESFVMNDSVSEFGVLNKYEILVTALREKYDSGYGGNGKYEVRFFSYDWRLSNQKSAEKLNEFITSNGYDKVVIVCHSMGGIISSVYMAEYGYDKIEKYVSLGTPYYGAVDALYAFETGKALDNILHIDDSLVKAFAPNFTGAYELLPVADSFDDGEGYIYYHNPLQTALSESELLDYSATETLLKTRSWYKEKLYTTAKDTYTKQYAKNTVSGVYSDIRSNKVDSYVIVGYNTDTVNGLVYTDNGLEDVLEGTGDGIVSLMSATMDNSEFARAPYYVKNLKHIEMSDSKGIARLVINIIDGKGDTLAYAWGCGLMIIRRVAPLNINEKSYKLTVDTPIITRFFDKTLSIATSISERMNQISAIVKKLHS